MGGGTALGRDPERMGGTTLGPGTGMDSGAALKPELEGGSGFGGPEAALPGFDTCGPEPELPGVCFGPERETRSRDGELAGAGVGRPADEESVDATGTGLDGVVGDGLRALIFRTMIATSAGRFQPSLLSFQTWTGCSGLSDTMYLAASVQLRGPFFEPSTGTNHSLRPGFYAQGQDFEGEALAACAPAGPDRKASLARLGRENKERPNRETRVFVSEASLQDHSTHGGGHHDRFTRFSGLWFWRNAAVEEREIEGHSA